MVLDDLLYLDQAAQESGLPRQVLRELLRSGRLPAVRQRGRWRIARADLARFAFPAETVTANCEARTETAQPFSGRGAKHGLVALLRERDAEVQRLQEERFKLAGLVGLLHAQVMERDARIAHLEACTTSAASSGDAGTHPPLKLTVTGSDEPGLPSSLQRASPRREVASPKDVSELPEGRPDLANGRDVTTTSTAGHESKARGMRRLVPALLRRLGRHA
jgi:excisionase family DNA binding protein